MCIRDNCTKCVPKEFDSILEEITHLAGCLETLRWTERRCSQCCKQRQKQGKWAGVWARLRAALYKPAMPSLFLTNACSHVNTMDITLWITSHHLNSCIMVMMETWLHKNISDQALELAGHTIY